MVSFSYVVASYVLLSFLVLIIVLSVIFSGSSDTIFASLGAPSTLTITFDQFSIFPSEYTLPEPLRKVSIRFIGDGYIDNTMYFGISDMDVQNDIVSVKFNGITTSPNPPVTLSNFVYFSLPENPEKNSLYEFEFSRDVTSVFLGSE
jgi:hypothetical protein